MTCQTTARWGRVAVLCTAGIAAALVGTSRSRAAESLPNVLIVLADDLGYSDLGCYGSEIATPVLDSLAMAGTVFANFHTAPTCSPTRAMLLTGVDHHLAGMGNMYEFLRSTPRQIGQPGYEGSLNRSVLTIAEVLKTAGYRTAVVGKWHLGSQLATSQAPIGRGFDRSWVLWTGWSEHYAPPEARPFVEGDRRVRYPEGRYSTEWYTDKAIEFTGEAIDEQKPFFLFAAYTAPHWPLEAPAELIARQQGKYDIGYDELRQRRIAGLVRAGILPPGIPVATTPPAGPPLQHEGPSEPWRPWDDLTPTEQTYSARLMEVYAAMIESLDQQVGRLLQHLRERGQYDNTLIIFLSDNGAASLSTPSERWENRLENVGRPGSFVAYGPQWARASTGPLRLVKGYSTEGGTRVPAMIKLPQQRQHRITAEFASVLDIAPTIYELAGATYPKSAGGADLQPLAGVSLLPYLSAKRGHVHDDNYSMGWELFGRAAFRQGRWKITWTEKPFGPSAFELFDIEADPGESRDLRSAYPEEYRRLLADFESYVREKGVIIDRPETW
jgi:arylsulfatase A-like enzyme